MASLIIPFFGHKSNDLSLIMQIIFHFFQKKEKQIFLRQHYQRLNVNSHCGFACETICMYVCLSKTIPMTEKKTLKTEKQAHVLVLTLNRPEALNALNLLVYKEINEVLDEVEADPGIKVLVITGDGKAFVAGADIAEMSGMNPEQAYEFSKTGQNTFDRLEALDIPVVAAVNGFALGGGCEFAMACDFRIASTKAKFGQPELNLGLIPGYAGTQRLSRLTGLGNALYLILTSEMIHAEEALRIGLVQKVTEPEQLMEVTMQLAHKIAENGSGAAVRAKRTIRDGFHMAFMMASDMEAQEFASLFGETATQEGMKAFLEKRKPEW